MNNCMYRRHKEALPTVVPQSLSLGGATGKLAKRISRNWLIGIRESNPAILEIFRDRDVVPYRDLLPWSGEFAGKHITGAYYIYQITRDRELYDDILKFIDELLTYQDEDGYIGCFAHDCRLTGAFSQNPMVTGCTWDAWNHYHIMYGLLMWYGIVKDERYISAVLKAADLFLRLFYNGKHTLASIGSTEMNLSVYHIFALIYEITGKEKYLDFAKNIEKDLSADNAGDYIGTSLKGIEFYQSPKPRWESMHAILGIAEMYIAAGDDYYLRSADHIVKSILKTDVHNTGAFSTDEQAIGNPYTNSNIETCCVVAFNALAARLANITADLSLIDFLEISHYNAVMGSFSPSGRWSTYNTPMDGVKCANFHSINFQSRPGSPELNCCSVNAPRGVGEVMAWMFTESDGALCVNFYESFDADFGGMKLKCESSYPAPGEVKLKIENSDRPVKLRIPGWSEKTSVIVDGVPFDTKAGSYFTVESDADIVISFDFSVHTLSGALDYEGKSSIYSGPVLYGADASLNPALDIRILPKIFITDGLLPAKQADGSIIIQTGAVTLSDFYHLGARGSSYRTWLELN